MGDLSILLTAATPGADSGSFEWAMFIAQKYAGMFANATWTTLYVAVTGTIVGFVLGFLVGVINTTRIHPEDFILKRILLKILRVIVAVYMEVFRGQRTGRGSTCNGYVTYRCHVACHFTAGIPECDPGDGKYICEQSENDIRFKCNRSF